MTTRDVRSLRPLRVLSWEPQRPAATPRPCVDCPATHAHPHPSAAPGAPGRRTLSEHLPTPDRSCSFRVAHLDKRAPVPRAWLGEFAFALVRRGFLVRQRIDAAGSATAIDVVGPGSAAFFGAPDSDDAGYAASDVMVCLFPSLTFERSCNESLPTTRDVLQLQTRTLARMDRLADARNRETAVEKVASLLRLLTEVLSPSRRYDVIPNDLQQRDLAALLGLRHESVCRALGELERAQAIARTRDGIACAGLFKK